MISEDVIERLVLDAPPGIYTEIREFHDSIEIGQTYVVTGLRKTMVVLVLELKVQFYSRQVINDRATPKLFSAAQVYVKCVKGEEIVHIEAATWTWSEDSFVHRSTAHFHKVGMDD